MESDPFDLQRFLDAQAPIYEQVRAELRAGRKASHWMWFVFPQIKGLGSSVLAEKFAISSLEEARAYLRRPVLGRRLEECAGLVNAVTGRSIEEIFPSPDDLKFRSCLTLFLAAAPNERSFRDALDTYFGGVRDERTLERL